MIVLNSSLVVTTKVATTISLLMALIASTLSLHAVVVCVLITDLHDINSVAEENIGQW